MNHLAESTSPYLLQHAANPVDWYPWGPEALERSRREDRPIFLSIGYAACRWCHVMEHESFEDPGIARMLNEAFVCIKVDREERPDIDDIYMSAVQLLTGHGGWPMTVFLTPDLKPFYCGTYFPPDDRYGHPGMRRLVPEVARIFRERRAEVDEQAGEMGRAMEAMASGQVGSAPGGSAELPPGRRLADRAAQQLLTTFDGEWGGFGGAPKFPPSMGLSLLLRHWRRTGSPEAERAVRRTLERMALGGIYDQVGGGFARYSTDARWHVPHFEKMLYDNALLASVYAEARLALGDTEDGLYRRVIEETLAFVDRELSDPAGGFHSSLDADSEGEEGRFYTWTAAELEEVLGPADAAVLAGHCEAGPEGNWEGGRSVLWHREPLTAEVVERLAPMKAKLLAARSRRVRPALDDKVLTAWNGLMVSALCRAAQSLDRPEWTARAVRAVEFLLSELRRDGRLLRSWRRGRAGLAGYLEDYAFLADGLVDLYEATFDPRWLREAEALVTTALRHFGDPAQGGFFFTADDHEELPARPRSAYDGATPSGNSVMAHLLVRLSMLLDRPEWRREAERTISAFAPSLLQVPGGHHRMLAAAEALDGGGPEVAIVGPAGEAATRELIGAVRAGYLPDRVVAYLDPAADDAVERVKLVPLLRGKTLVDGRPAAYVCRNFTCRRPVTTAAELVRQLETESGFQQS